MFVKTMKCLLLVLMTLIVISVFTALASILLYAFALAVIAALLGAVLAPDEVKAFWLAFADKVDGWIERLEKLWKEVRSGLDIWGEALMSAQGKKTEAKTEESLPVDQSSKAD